MTYDAFGRAVEVNVSGVIKDYQYNQLGQDAAIQNGAVVNSYIPEPGGASVLWDPVNGTVFEHKDWLGSARVGSLIPASGGGSIIFDRAFAPFGETYDTFGSAGYPMNFTGNRNGIATFLYDTPNREDHPGQGRWPSPDPAGLAAVDMTNPQTWNRYAYMMNNPLNSIDPSGLACWPYERAWLGGSCANVPQEGVDPWSSWNEFQIMNIPVAGGSGAGPAFLFNFNSRGCPALVASFATGRGF
jgi:RHS repeat-associated protein